MRSWMAIRGRFQFLHVPFREPYGRFKITMTTRITTVTVSTLFTASSRLTVRSKCSSIFLSHPYPNNPTQYKVSRRMITDRPTTA
jgi:hypothetical protein